MIRKVFRSGNSLVVALPTESLQQRCLEDVSEGDVALTDDRTGITVKSAAHGIAIMSPEYVSQVDAFIDAYRPALEELSER